MIHVVLPPAWRGSACPFVQRTQALLNVLESIGEAIAPHPFDETFGYTEGDLIFYSYPPSPEHVEAVRNAGRGSGVVNVECGVGYDIQPWGPLRVYESEAWRHYCFAKHSESLDRRRSSWVIPWAFDASVWPLGEGRGGYVSYLGRLMPDKGIEGLKELARRLPTTPFKVASTDDVCGLGQDMPANMTFVGPVLGEARAEFLGNAVVHVCPTEFVEPLCGSAIEAMLCGTPALCSNYGGFTETVIDNVSGFRCASVDEMVTAMSATVALDRSTVRAVTKVMFGMAAAAARWKKALVQMRAYSVSKKNIQNSRAFSMPVPK